MRVSDIITSPVVGIGPSAPIADAAKLMFGSHFSGLLVITGDNRLVPAVTEGDVLQRDKPGTMRKRPNWLESFSAGEVATEYIQTYGRKIEEVMPTDTATICTEALLEALVELTTWRKTKRVPGAAGGKLVGLVARCDRMRALPASTSQANDDECVRQAIVEELETEDWSGAIRVSGDHGVAELSGAIFDESAREAARVCAENVTSGKSDTDQLAWIEPMSGIYISPETERQA